MKFSDFMKLWDDVMREHHRKYMEWLKTQDISKPPEPGIEITKSNEIDYIEEKSGDDAPVSDNPSGLYCPSCRSTGVMHCAHPNECGGMRRMKST